LVSAPSCLQKSLMTAGHGEGCGTGDTRQIACTAGC
jgi:hypothetical protein